MAKFCRYCGKPIPENSRFCPECGKVLIAAAPQQTAQTAPPPTLVQSAPQQQPTWQEQYRQIHSQSGVRTAERTAPPQPPAYQPQQPTYQQPPQSAYQQPQQPTYQAPQPTYQPQQPAQTTVQTAAQTVRSAARSVSATLTGTKASAAAGEVDFGELDLDGTGVGAVARAAGSVLSPVAGLFRGAGQYLGGALKIFIKPGALIGTVLLAGLWFALEQFGDSLPEGAEILKWLTYADGGYDRSALGTVGGILGKGTVAAALISLLKGGLPRLFKGIGALFTGHGERRGILAVLFGIIIGGAVYMAFAGQYASAETAMAGIAGSMLSLEALGGGSGKLYSLAQSLTSRKVEGVRTAMRGKCDGLLTGLTLGFGIMTALSVAGVLEGLL